MDSEDIKSYLLNIEETLFDEKKIVTYNWLSRTFGIHCNVSKQLLFTFFDNCPKKGELSVTYLLIGQAHDNDSCQVLIVKDKDVDEVERSLKSITSKHIYSIQRCPDLADINVLYTPVDEVSRDAIQKGLSSIEFDNKERDSVLIAQLRGKALPTPATQSALAKKPPPPAAKNPPPSPAKTKSPVKAAPSEVNRTNSSSGHEKTSDPNTENKKTVVPSMFNKNNASGPKKKPAAKPVAKNKKPQGSIGAFFTKTVNKPAPVKKSTDVVESTTTKKEVDENIKIKTKPIVDEKLSPSKENKATLNIRPDEEKKIKKIDSPKKHSPKAKKPDNKTKTASKKTPKNKGSKKNAGKKGENDQKKRKRLMLLSDSESNASSEEEEEIQREPTPEPQPTVIPDDDDMDDIIQGTPEPSKKRKKRSLVSRTFKGDDGFLVTEKHYEEVSASDNEDPVPEKKFKGDTAQDIKTSATVNKTDKKESSPNKKSSPPQKVKQASLMSFFKKK